MVTKEEALKLALEALDSKYIVGCGEWRGQQLKALTAIKEALAQPAQEPDELKHIGEEDCLLDVDETAWYLILENRGGCRCHNSPPCAACSDQISEEEMKEIGYTYTNPPQRPWVGLTDKERNKLWRDVIKWGDPSHDDVDLMKTIEAKLKDKNT